ncbi:MAG TPA: DeoR/GlpR family DNA-binding transcription regulator [Steroidobacteraceae bacterium]|nr:DeoR/GlpR family DNA-binding transcription regulator [Steroidobacteraceae bacterium]
MAQALSEPGLMAEERRRRICELLRSEGRVRVEALATRFGTSTVTIRADLSSLEAAGALTRTHGGALNVPEADQPLSVKELQHRAEKLRIAEAAAALIRDGETLILDSGTTTAEIARRIRALPLRAVNVITNALNIAALLIDVPSVRLIMPGGILRRDSNSLSGPMAEAALATLTASRLYLGADGIDPQIGIMTPHVAEAELNAKMIAMSAQVVVVADSSKFARRNISLIARIEQVHMLITDRAAPAEAVEQLRVRGVAVRLV